MVIDNIHSIVVFNGQPSYIPQSPCNQKDKHLKRKRKRSDIEKNSNGSKLHEDSRLHNDCRPTWDVQLEGQQLPSRLVYRFKREGQI